MKLCSYVKFDLTVGLWRRGMCAKYLFWFALFILPSLEFSGYISSMEYSAPSLGDCLLYIFGGMREYIPIPGESFKVPYLWLINHLGILYFTLHYMHDDLEGFGQQMIMRSGSRFGWWLSKCVWNIAAVVIFYLAAWLMVFITSMLRGASCSFEISSYMYDVMEPGENYIIEANWDLLLEVTLMPLLTTMALSLFQMLLCLVIRPTFSYVFSIVLLIASAYYLSPALLGNYSMAIRSDKIITNGVSLYGGLAFSLALCVLSVVLGVLIFRKTNILTKEE